MLAHRRHNIRARIWEALRPPGRKARLDAPQQTTGYSSTPMAGVVWEGLLKELMEEPDFKWSMIDASHCKVDQIHLEQSEELKI